MIKNYIKTALRFLLKNKTFSFINIIGLAAGTLCCLYILLYVQDQYSYDRHFKDAGNIYRITSNMNFRGDKRKGAATSPPTAPTMKADFNEVLQYARVVNSGLVGTKQHLVRYKEKSFYETDALFADPGFFDIFTYHFVNGDSRNPLKDPYNIVLLKPMADKLFGTENPVGKMISIDNAYGKHDFKVTAVIDESLGKSHLHGNMFIAMNSGGIGAYVNTDQTWSGNNFVFSYIKLRPNTNVTAFQNKLPAFLNKYGAQELKNLGMQKELILQPVTKIHTTPGFEIELSPAVNPSFLYILILIAVLIQVIACINFMNLSTARASKRAKEVGVRKVIGASQSNLITQFLGESFLLSFIGVALALPLLILAMPYLNQITHTDIQLCLFSNYRIWVLLSALIVITGLVAGSYPAFYLSAFKSIKVIKGNFTSHVSAAGIRRSLVVFQFVLSIVLITGIIVIYSQLNFIKNKDLGFDKNQKLVFSFYTGETQGKMANFANDLRQLADIKAVTKSDNYPGQLVLQDHGVYPPGGNMTTAVDADNMASDEHFLKTTGIKLIAGRDFTQNDSGKVIINETLLKKLGLTLKTAIGTRLYTQYLPNPVTYVEIAGVMKDFNYNSLHNAIRPFMLAYNPNRGDLSNLIVAANSSNYKTLLSQIEALWHKDVPSAPFEYSFLDEEVNKQYTAEITLSQIINTFTLMAILISCLGLFGLAAFSAEQRNKEIGIRKVLGASVTGLVRLLSIDFLKLVLIAMIIATPIAWWGMDKWLQAFAYRIPISWWMFGLAGLIAVCIAMFTVSFQAIKAALVNPVKSLKSE
ncbi:ABC transporter permease [Mucilaginibacter agri]|uniref:ABC transporter permease n=1 Tax=Mucilaginibacter agri TaxID=2695265 RepID=UPI001411D5FF|nr:ABC transporter permease [Mucilaginibacter agri]